MTNAHILLGFQSPELAIGLKKELAKNGVDAVVVSKFTKASVKRYVEENEDCSVVILMERIGSEKFVAEEVAQLTDKRDINVIIGLSGRLYGTEYMKVLYTANITNALLFKGRDDGASVMDLVPLILNRRSRKEAREYYGIEGQKIDLGFMDDDLYLDFHADLTGMGGTLLENYIEVCKKLSPQQIADFTRRLPEDELNELIKYEEFHTVIDMLKKVGYTVKVKRPKKRVIGLRTPAQISFKEEGESTSYYKEESATVNYTDVHKAEESVSDVPEVTEEELVNDVEEEKGMVPMDGTGELSLDDIFALLDGEKEFEESPGVKEEGMESLFSKEEVKEKESPSEHKEVENKYIIDPITGVYNRVAFEELVGTLDAKDIGIVNIDVNDLKVINDTKGHEMGDKLLADVAGAMVQIWNRENCYRTGGDEFVVICKAESNALVNEKIKNFKKLLDGKGFSAAVGYADSFKVGIRGTVQDILRASDESMYEDKHLYKEKKQEERRKIEQKRIEEEEAKRRAEMEREFEEKNAQHQKEMDKLKKEQEEAEKQREAKEKRERKELEKQHQKEIKELKAKEGKLKKELAKKEKQLLSAGYDDDDEEDDVIISYNDKKFSFGFIILLLLMVLLVIGILYAKPILGTFF